MSYVTEFVSPSTAAKLLEATDQDIRDVLKYQPQFNRESLLNLHCVAYFHHRLRYHRRSGESILDALTRFYEEDDGRERDHPASFSWAVGKVGRHLANLGRITEEEYQAAWVFAPDWMNSDDDDFDRPLLEKERDAAIEAIIAHGEVLGLQPVDEHNLEEVEIGLLNLLVSLRVLSRSAEIDLDLLLDVSDECARDLLCGQFR